MQMLPNQRINKNVDIDTNMLRQKLNDYRYDESDTFIEINGRVERCLKKSERGMMKKADSSLNKTSLADVEESIFWESLKSKYPDENRLAYVEHGIVPKFALDGKQVLNIMANLNVNSSTGPGGISNTIKLGCKKK